MSKHTIIGVIVLMSISLLGVVGLQLYWITDAIKVRQEQFDRSVYDALAKVVAKLETREAVSVVNNQIAALDTPRIKVDTVSLQTTVPVAKKKKAPVPKPKAASIRIPQQTSATPPTGQTQPPAATTTGPKASRPETITIRGFASDPANVFTHSEGRIRGIRYTPDSVSVAFILKNKAPNETIVYHNGMVSGVKVPATVYTREHSSEGVKGVYLPSKEGATKPFRAKVGAASDVRFFELTDSALSALTQRTRTHRISVDTLVFLASQFDSLRRFDKNLGINPSQIRSVDIRNDSIIVLKNRPTSSASTTFWRTVPTTPLVEGVPLRQHRIELQEARSVQGARAAHVSGGASTAVAAARGEAVRAAQPGVEPAKPRQPAKPAPVIPSPDRIEIKKDKISDVVEKMVVEYVVRERPLKERLNLTNFDTLLQSELANQGIDLNYGYWIVSDAADTVATRPVPNANIQALPVYKASLFPNDIFDKADHLGVMFPESKTYALKSLWFMLLCSVGFTLIIMVTFGTTIHIIYKQKKLSEMKNDFINNMTHEFKTPIATISLATDSISNPKVYEKPERIQYYTKIIREENKRMNAQVENVLQIALLEKNEFKMNLQPVDVHELIVKAVDSIRLQVEQRTGQVTAQLNALQHELQSDEVHLYNVICNLLDNANKYSPATPDIHLITQNIEGGLVIAVEDKGMGMSKDTQQRVFDKFYRVPTGNLHNVKGFGLGLSYVKAIVQAHHGEIKLRSELGKGSRFEIFLPFKN